MSPALSELSVTSRHVWLIIAHGLAGDAPRGLDTSDQPNLKTVGQIGMRIRHCTPPPGNSPEAALETLLFGSKETGGGLAEFAASAGRQVFQVLPWRSDRWVAENTRSPHWSLVEGRLDRTVADWEDLLQGQPEFLAAGPNAADAEAFFRDRVLARFPGRATMLHQRSAGRDADALAAWMEWAGDAFLRGLWYASARADAGVFALLAYPAPASFAERNGSDGYQRGLEVLDDLVGRLLLLREHEDLMSSTLVVYGDYAHPSADASGSRLVPCLALGPELEGVGTLTNADFSEVADFLRKLVASRPSRA